MRVIQTRADFIGYRNQFERVERMLARLYTNATDERAFIDDFLSFCMHCTHLREWVACDKKVPASAKRKVSQGLKAAKWYPICRDIAVRCKHIVIDTPRSGTGARFEYVEQTKRPDQDHFTLDIILDDGHGKPLSGLALVLWCHDEWRTILKAAGLATKRR